MADSRQLLDPAIGLRARAPLTRAMELLEALSRHVAALVEGVPGGLNRSVELVGTQGSKGRRVTVANILVDEIAHARHHLTDITEAKRSGVSAARRSASNRTSRPPRRPSS